MRFIGMDVHRDFCEVAIWEEGEVRSTGRVKSTEADLELFAQSLGEDDQVAMEMSGNARAVAAATETHVARVVLADPRKVRERLGNGPRPTASTPGRSPSSAPAASSPRSGCPTSRRG